MSNRLEFIDIAKGLGIMLVIMGHIEHDYVPFCGSVHIPMFFVIAGYLCDLTKYEDKSCGFVVAKRCKRLLIPYFVYNMVLYLKYLAKLILSHGTVKEALSAFLGFIYSASILLKDVPANENFEGFVFGNGPLWFLTAMAASSAIFYCIIYYVLKHRFDMKKIALSAALLIAASWTLLQLLPVYLPWSFEMSLVGCVFMLFGLVLRNFNAAEFIKSHIYVPVIALVAFALLHHFNGSANMAICVYGKSLVVYVILGMLGSVLMLWLAFLIEKSALLGRAVAYVGRNTLIILAFHMTIISLMVSALTKLHMEKLLNWGGFFMIRFAAGLFGCLILSEILRRITKGAYNAYI